MDDVLGNIFLYVKSAMELQTALDGITNAMQGLNEISFPTLPDGECASDERDNALIAASDALALIAKCSFEMSRNAMNGVKIINTMKGLIE